MRKLGRKSDSVLAPSEATAILLYLTRVIGFQVDLRESARWVEISAEKKLGEPSVIHRFVVRAHGDDASVTTCQAARELTNSIAIVIESKSGRRRRLMPWSQCHHGKRRSRRRI